MKRIISLILILTVLATITIISFAERFDNSDKWIEDWIDTSNISEKEILFRNLEWYDTRENIVHLLNQSGIETEIENPYDVINCLFYDISAICISGFYHRLDANNYPEIEKESKEMNDIINMEGSESTVKFSDDDVAGHKAEVTLHFLNPVSDNEFVVDSDKSRFIYAEYRIDYSSISGYKDIDVLYNKLTGIYGKSYAYDEPMYNAYWKDENGGRIILEKVTINNIFKNSKDEYIMIIYIAPNFLSETKEQQEAIWAIRENERLEKEQRENSIGGL